MMKKYGDKEVTAERLRKTLFKLETKDVSQRQKCWHGPTESIAKDSLLSCVDYHCWCVDKEGEVNDHISKDSLTGEFTKGTKIVRRP